MSQPEFLSTSELHQLTGYARAKAQAAWLRAEGIPFKANGKGLPVVRREHARAWVEGKPLPVPSGGLNWSAVK
jgi:hypothetical protein